MRCIAVGVASYVKFSNFHHSQRDKTHIEKIKTRAYNANLKALSEIPYKSGNQGCTASGFHSPIRRAVPVDTLRRIPPGFASYGCQTPHIPAQRWKSARVPEPAESPGDASPGDARRWARSNRHTSITPDAAVFPASLGKCITFCEPSTEEDISFLCRNKFFKFLFVIKIAYRFFESAAAWLRYRACQTRGRLVAFWRCL